MNRWIAITEPEQINSIFSNKGFSILFKHSTQCPVSMMSKKQFEWDMKAIPENVPVYFLDLIRYRSISNAISETFNVKHESPQVILIDSGVSIYHTSHGDISASKLGELITESKPVS